MLHDVRNQEAQILWASEAARPAGANRSSRVKLFTRVLVVILYSALASQHLCSQQKRMVIDGSILMVGAPLPPTTKIRILHEDGSIARNVSLYDPRNMRFGVRLSSQDDYAENERILFRVIVSPADSFLARIVGPPVIFKGTDVSEAAPTNHLELFRNTLPTIYRTLPDTTIKEGQELHHRLVAVDRDADTVRFRMKNAPTGTKLDLITGMFSWKPTYDQAGKYRITFMISDGYDIDSSRSVSITVQNVNRPPYFVSEMPDTTIREADTLRYTIRAADPDSDQVFYRSVNILEGMRVDSTTGAVVWIPTYEQAGEYRIGFLASDGTDVDTSRSTRITVTNVNRPPVFVAAMNDTTIQENQELIYSYVAMDADRDSVWYSLLKGPNGADFISKGLFRWRPTFLQAGDYTIEVLAHDQVSSTIALTRIRVLNTNRPPSPPTLTLPSNNDTVRLTLIRPILFAWSRSTDEDIDDTLRYRIHLWGPRLDTVLSKSTDSTSSHNIKPHLQPLSTYHWAVIVDDGSLNISSVDTFSFRTSVGISGSAELLSQIPRSYDLEQGLSDPFNPTITIRYALPERSFVRLTIFNMLGEPILVLVSGEKDAGVYGVTFDTSEFTSGAYMFRLDAHPLAGNQSKDFVNTKKMFIVR